MKTVNITVNKKTFQVQSGKTILQVLKDLKIKVPTLCFLKNVCEDSNCRICVVENVANGRLITSCNSVVYEGLNILTDSKKVVQSRRETLKMLISVHHKDCKNCIRNNKCSLQKLCEKYDVNEAKLGVKPKYKIDKTSPCIIRDCNKCIVCGRCISVCGKTQEVHALTKFNRGFETQVGTVGNQGMKHSTCVGCGQCVLVCPTAALVENSEIEAVKKLIKNKNNFVVAQVAPSVRVALGEEFGKKIGSFDEGKLAACLHALGFKKVFDINAGADFTTYEEAHELIERINNNHALPQFSSCCPAWHKYVHTFYPDYAEHLSTCKSPTEMLGAIIKNYYVKKEKIKNIKVVGIMPCVAKKGERLRGNDVDAVLTTRELAMMIKEGGLDYHKIKPEKFDKPFSQYSGAGLIYGATGGVTESVLRTAMEILDENDLTNIDFETVRKSEGIKEVEVKGKNLTLRLCVVNGLANAKKAMDNVIAGKANYHFMEVMACPGGCLNGGGQPCADYDKVDVGEVIAARANTIYEKDKKMRLRQSHKNAAMKEVYKQFFVPSPGKAHELLHHSQNIKKELY